MVSWWGRLFIVASVRSTPPPQAPLLTPHIPNTDLRLSFGLFAAAYMVWMVALFQDWRASVHRADVRHRVTVAELRYRDACDAYDGSEESERVMMAAVDEREAARAALLAMEGGRHA